MGTIPNARLDRSSHSARLSTALASGRSRSPTNVVLVQVSQDNRGHVGRPVADARQLRAQLLLGFELILIVVQHVIANVQRVDLHERAAAVPGARSRTARTAIANPNAKYAARSPATCWMIGISTTIRPIMITLAPERRRESGECIQCDQRRCSR